MKIILTFSTGSGGKALCSTNASTAKSKRSCRSFCLLSILSPQKLVALMQVADEENTSVIEVELMEVKKIAERALSDLVKIFWHH